MPPPQTWLPLMRELSIADSRQLTEGEKTWEYQIAAFMESYFDILFAVNGQTHPGEKRLIQRCKACCDTLPEDFEENINRLFYHMYTAPQEVNGDIARIVGQLQRIL